MGRLNDWVLKQRVQTMGFAKINRTTNLERCQTTRLTLSYRLYYFSVISINITIATNGTKIKLMQAGVCNTNTYGLYTF